MHLRNEGVGYIKFSWSGLVYIYLLVWGVSMTCWYKVIILVLGLVYRRYTKRESRGQKKRGNEMDFRHRIPTFVR